MKYQKMRRRIAVLLSVTLIATVFSVSAFAWNDQFRVYLNGGPKFSNACVKLTPGRMYGRIDPNASVSDAWDQGNELIYTRGRDLNYTQCTELGKNWYAGNLRTDEHVGSENEHDNLCYYSGFGYIGYSYRIAVEYYNGNPHEYADVVVSWNP